MLVEHLEGFSFLFALMQIDHGSQNLVVIAMEFFKNGVLDLVFVRGDRALVITHLLLQTHLEVFEAFGLFSGEALPLLQAKHFLGPQVSVDPGTANHRAVIQPGQRVFTNAGFADFDL